MLRGVVSYTMTNPLPGAFAPQPPSRLAAVPHRAPSPRRKHVCICGEPPPRASRTCTSVHLGCPRGRPRLCPWIPGTGLGSWAAGTSGPRSSGGGLGTSEPSACRLPAVAARRALSRDPVPLGVCPPATRTCKRWVLLNARARPTRGRGRASVPCRVGALVSGEARRRQQGPDLNEHRGRPPVRGCRAVRLGVPGHRARRRAVTCAVSPGERGHPQPGMSLQVPRGDCVVKFGGVKGDTWIFDVHVVQGLRGSHWG